MALLLYLLFVFCNSAWSASEVIRQGQKIKDGETVLSAGGTFEMGFFSPGSSRKRYFGVWLTNQQSEMVVWVANKENPIEDYTGVLKLDERGQLQILDEEEGQVVWCTQDSSHTGSRLVAELLDSGNLVVRDFKMGVLWQSIDEPTNVMLPGMKISTNQRTGEDRYITSWKSPDDPAPGNYTMKMDFSMLPRVMLTDGNRVRTSSGHFNGLRFVGIPYIQPNPILRFIIQATEDQADYSFEMNNNSTLSMLILGHDGIAQRVIIDKESQMSKTFTYLPADECDRFSPCGAFGLCNMSNFPVCGCLEGYVPSNLREWNSQNTDGGCVRQFVPDCEGGDGFLLMRQLKLPHLINSSVIMNMSLSECRENCARDCSCTAYTSADVTDDRGGCIMWFGDLLDIRVLETEVHDLYVRVPASSLVGQQSKKNKRQNAYFIVVLGLVVSAVLLLLFFLYIVWEKTRKNAILREKSEIHVFTGLEEGDKLLFDLQTVESATSGFLPENKIGEGGYGIVYKGVLPDGREIAVKKLIRVSAKGLTEFSNEIKSIARLRHRNLVPLLGWCVAGEEKMVVYEFMKNKSLDTFIFDEKKRTTLEWRTRLDIVLGIARGLKYLHHDSGSRIIHRDLKAGNVLLDDGMIPKISDFGIARNLCPDQVLHKTSEVVGTCGYMSPEYAIDGIISTKSDVFSFGVLTLEIISGERTRGFYMTRPEENLLSKAWKLWKDGRCQDLLDDAPTGVPPTPEVLRCVQIALLCVQQQVEDRPSMANVIMMLTCETYPLPEPKTPGFVLPPTAISSTVSSSLKEELSPGNGETNALL